MRVVRSSGLATLSSVSFIALAFGLGSPALAQTAPDEPPAPSGAAGDAPNPECLNMPEGDARDRCISGEVELESGQAVQQDDSIVVTGTRIKRPNLESPVPVTSVSAEDLTSQGDVNVGDALNDLPSLRSTFSQANSTRFIGTTGLNILDLRGLGTSRTLVLVNGRRHITASPGDYLVDVNTIPTDLLERVDIVTGGNSAVYGSDAVAGVVNFVTKRDFEGLRLRGQAGVSSRGDRPIQFATLTAGKNFFDNRANVAANLEYAHASALYFRQRDELTGASSGRCQFNNADSTVGEPQSGDNVPDLQFFCGVINAGISDTGNVSALNPFVFIDGRPTVIPCNDPRVGPAGPFAALGAQRCLNPGTPQGALRFLNFNADGTLCEVRPAMDFRPFGSGNYIHDPNAACQARGSTLRRTGQLAPELDRYTANILAHFEVTEAFQPFFEGKFVHIKSLQEFQPTFNAFTPMGLMRCNNPFLDAQDVAVLQTIGRCPTPTSVFFLNRFNVDLGGRQERTKRDTYRVVGGARGTFNDDWNYEVALNYGHFKQRGRHHNDIQLFDLEGNPAGYLLAVNAVRDANGNIVCAVNADADPTNDVPACVPFNPFGESQFNPASEDFFEVTSRLDQKASQTNAVAFVSGDTSEMFELPGGAPRFVVGAEWRKETAHIEADPLSAADATFFNAFQEFDPPAMKVAELFGELEIPILRDRTLFEELTVAAAGRWSDYNKGAGTANRTFAYNINGVWSPVRDARLRANYSKSVRVPTLSDLFTPETVNFGFVSDPCDAAFINAGPNRARNCAALGVPAGFVNTVARTRTIQFISRGNPDLEEETGKSLTIGGVVTPRWVPGLSLSVDYYKIKVENLISTLSAQQILNTCVDLPDINNQFCSFIFPRQADDPTTPDVNEAGLLAEPGLFSQGANFARQEASGIDFEAVYRRNFANGHRLNLRGIATRVLKRDNYVSPTDPNFRDQQLLELGDPRWAANAVIGYGFGPIDLRYSLNFIGKTVIGSYENYFPVQDRDPTNPDLTRERYYPGVTYHAARVGINVPEGGRNRMTFYFGMDNIFDTPPPFGLLGTSGGDPYDSIGRYVYAGATVDF